MDSTGNSDIAAAAGARRSFQATDRSRCRAQACPRFVASGRDFFNSDFTLVDENDMVDVWQMQLYTRFKYPNAFDTAPFIDSRERRRIEGETTQTVLDQVNDRTYPDTVNMAYSNLDSHTFSVHPYLETELILVKLWVSRRACPTAALFPRGWKAFW